MHGSADDNVHPQNSYKMAYELVRAGKKFDMMIYPDDNHSMVPNGVPCPAENGRLLLENL